MKGMGLYLQWIGMFIVHALDAGLPDTVGTALKNVKMSYLPHAMTLLNQ